MMISIIVPVYRVEEYIKECIDSILAQTYTDLEIILVDDGSPDNCGNICEDYSKKDERIKVIHKSNGGLSDARNAGIKAAKGEYIGFVDSDDWIEPNMYETLYKACSTNNADIAICGFYRDYTDKSIACVKFNNEIITGDDAVKKLIDGSQIQDHAWAKLYKTELWDNIDYPVGKNYEDVRTTYKTFIRAKRVCTVNKALYHYRQRAGSISKAGLDSNKLEWLDAVYEQAGFLRNNDILGKEYDYFFERKIVYTKGCLFREWLLIENDRAAMQYLNEAQNIYQDIRHKKKIIARDDFFPKSIKIIGALSFLPLRCIRNISKNIIVKHHFSKIYHPYV